MGRAILSAREIRLFSLLECGEGEPAEVISKYLCGEFGRNEILPDIICCPGKALSNTTLVLERMGPLADAVQTPVRALREGVAP